jgi:hypothetical protein
VLSCRDSRRSFIFERPEIRVYGHIRLYHILLDWFELWSLGKLGRGGVLGLEVKHYFEVFLYLVLLAFEIIHQVLG